MCNEYEIIYCDNCGKELTYKEIMEYGETCRRCMKMWEREKWLMEKEYRKMVL